MKKQSNKITALYCRVASDGPCGQEAVEAQEKYLIQYAKELSLENIYVFSDCGFSGLNFNRPAFQEMLVDIEGGRVGALVVWSIDRLTRNACDLMCFIEKLLQQHDITLHNVKGIPYVATKALLTSDLQAQEKGAWA